VVTTDYTNKPGDKYHLQRQIFLPTIKSIGRVIPPQNSPRFNYLKMGAVQKAKIALWGEIPPTKEERKLILKIDWFILPFCCLA